MEGHMLEHGPLYTSVPFVMFGEGGWCGVVWCIEMRHRHHGHFVRLRNDLKGITSMMNHQVQHVMDDCACNAQDD